MAVVCSLLMEAINRQRVALALAAILGVAGLFLASKYELKEAASASDTMPSMVAVLDTNFWLATHVTTITMGYAAALLASALAHAWLIGKIFGLKKGDSEFYRSIGKMLYGVLCFALVFCVVGTILGGIWANYSWGRFWGWDPKENGALLICLWQIFIIHARLGGYVRDWGLCVLSVRRTTTTRPRGRLLVLEGSTRASATTPKSAASKSRSVTPSPITTSRRARTCSKSCATGRLGWSWRGWLSSTPSTSRPSS